ncbi:MAG: hypothetical protein HOV79_11170 [Hamadaea sp.]|nr:hypothetical protein [Hamadaea sp.]
MERTELPAETGAQTDDAGVRTRPRPRLATPSRPEPAARPPGARPRARNQRRPATPTPAADGDRGTESAASGVQPGKRHGLPVTRVLVLVLVLAFAAAAYAGHGWWNARKLETAHAEAIAAGRQLATNFVSISAATVDADLARIATGATGEFGEEFGRSMPTVRSAVLENKVQSTGTVLRAGLVSGDVDSAVVLVAVDATVKNVKAPDGRVSHYRIQVDLTRDPASGAWLAAKLQFVG